MTRRTTRVLRTSSVVVAVVVAGGAASTGLAAADSYVPISGAGSTWSYNAIEQWRKNVNQYGLRVNYASTGSSDGRNQFRQGTVDFAVSEIPYGLKDAGVVDAPPTRKYAYMPIVAGGTSFMYNLRIGGKRVTSLRLSSSTITKIFTGVITSWSDKEIKAENPGLVLPARRIVPVVRGDGSGTTAQFSAYMASEQPALWDAYCRKANRPTPCGTTSIFPVLPGTGFTAQAGSLGVSGYVSQQQNEGTITYVEYSYAKNAGFPVVKLLNKAGYFVQPSPQNVAVGLLKAVINNDPKSPKYLTPDLTGVYRNQDARAYPLSSYSYMIVPTALEGTFSAAKGNALGAFAYYFLCEGQQQAGKLGFSPLPVNLVSAGLAQVKRIPGVKVESVDIKKCNNPTFSSDGTNTLAKTAPFPPTCDKAGPLQCGTSKSGGSNGGSGSGGGSSGTGGTGTTGGAGTGGTGTGGTGGTGTGGTGTGGTGTGGTQGATTIDPDTGQVVPAGDGSTGDGTTTGGDPQAVAAVPVSAAAGTVGASSTTLLVIAAAVLLGAVTIPPLVVRALRKDGAA
ncbi:MAG: phosphate ABC transporter substrate-binding protein PstS [Acidimicrobiia bacterium]